MSTLARRIRARWRDHVVEAPEARKPLPWTGELPTLAESVRPESWHMPALPARTRARGPWTATLADGRRETFMVDSLTAVKAALRRLLGVRRLPAGIEWKAARPAREAKEGNDGG